MKQLINFLPLNRNIQNHWLWEDKPFSKGQAWIDLLLLANYTDKKSPYKDGMRVYKRGTVNLSLCQLSVRWGWDRRSVKRFMNVLESDGMVSLKCTTHGTTITLINYETFNSDGTTDSTAKCTTDGTTDGTTKCTTDSTTNVQPYVQQMPTTNIDNIDNKDNIEINKKTTSKGEPKQKRFIKPTAEEIEAYCKERGNGISGQEVFDYYEMVGWVYGKDKPIKDWQAAIRNSWERKRGFVYEQKENKISDDLKFTDKGYPEGYYEICEQHGAVYDGAVVVLDIVKHPEWFPPKMLEWLKKQYTFVDTG